MKPSHPSPYVVPAEISTEHILCDVIRADGLLLDAPESPLAIPHSPHSIPEQDAAYPAPAADSCGVHPLTQQY